MYGTGNDIRLVILGPFAFFSNFILTTSSRKPLEDTTHAHIVSLINKLRTNAKDSDGLSIGFYRSRDRRRDELVYNKNKKKVNTMLELCLKLFSDSQNTRKKLLMA